jgi:hypothetical protein
MQNINDRIEILMKNVSETKNLVTKINELLYPMIYNYFTLICSFSFYSNENEVINQILDFIVLNNPLAKAEKILSYYRKSLYILKEFRNFL